MTENSSPSRDAAGRDRSIFERSVVPMWEEDISRLRGLIAEWMPRAGKDLRTYLHAHPPLVRDGVRAIRVVDVNSAAVELYDAAGKADLLGPLDATLDEDALKDFIELFAAIAEGRQHVEAESTARTLSGRKLDVLVKTFIPRPQDDYPYLLVNVLDFTEYKELEKNLQQQQSLVRSVIDSIPDQMFVKSVDGKFLLANEPLARWAGESSASELIGKTDYDFFPAETADSFRADDAEIVRSGKARIDFEEEITSAAGKRAWASTSKIPFKSASGEIAGIIGIVRDMTEQRRREREIEEERTLLRTAVKHLPDLIFLKDAGGRFLVANQAVAETMHAGNPESLIGKTDFDFYPLGMAEEYAADERRLMETGESIVNKEEPKVVRGETRWILTSKVPIFDERGNATGIVGVGRDISTLKQAQEALAKSEERYRLLVEDIGVGIISSDASGEITFANRVVGQIFGLPRGLAQGRNIQDFITVEAFTAVAAEIQKRKPGDRSGYEIPITRSDGQRRWIHLIAVSRFDAAGTFVGSFATMQDVTDLHNAQAELTRQRALMQALLDTVPDYIYFKDRESRFILNNQAHARALGARDPAEMIGKTDFDYFSEEHARKAFNDELRIIATGVPLVNDVEKETWENRPTTWVSTTKAPLRNEKGEIIGTFGISRDMTEQRTIEQRNIRLAAMVESSRDAIIGIDLDDVVTDWNSGAERMFGYSAAEMIGTSINPLLSSDVTEKVPMLREKLQQEGHVMQMESTAKRKDGQTIFTSSTVSFVRDADGQIVGITCISRDMTSQRAMQVQLIRAQRLESLGTLAAGIAHQFNNINMAVQGYLDFLSRDDNLPATAKKHIREATKAVQRAVDITERLQGLSAGASFSSREVLRLEESVPAIIALFAERLKREGVMLHVDLPPTQPVKVNQSMIEFILTSLLTNSMHALIDCPAPSITVSAACAAGFCSLQVSDTGCGIPAENMQRIFTPFFTTKGEWAAPGSTQAGVKGIGLSLAVCQSAVAESGGWIEVESPPQGGTTFRVWLPAAGGT